MFYSFQRNENDLHSNIHNPFTLSSKNKYNKFKKKTNSQHKKIKAKQYFKEMAETTKAKRNASQQQQQIQQQQLPQIQPKPQQQSAERYNLLSSSIDERAPVPQLVPKPLSVV